MKKFRFFAALCCAAAVFAACEKNEPKDDSNNSNNDQNEESTDTDNNYNPKNDTKEAVDLGLSVKWATCNVGASKPEEYGNYYAWGETTTKNYYDWSTYKYCIYSVTEDGQVENTITKYNYEHNMEYTYPDMVSDSLTVLEACDDAAVQNWGGAWRMPTEDEWWELRSNCEWELTYDYNGTGVEGYKVMGKNGNSIFLPAAGSFYYERRNGVGGYYWSSQLGDGQEGSMYFATFQGFEGDYFYDGNEDRSIGLSVRPVCE